MSKNKTNFCGFSLLISITFILLISKIKCILEIPIQTFNFHNPLKSESISIDKNNLLVGKIKIGSANQEFNLILDTTSWLSWVPLEGSKDQYPIQNHYNPEQSTTSKKTDKAFQLDHSGYYCEGEYYEDELQFIDNKKFNFKFGVANETKFNPEEADGILGLAYDFNEEKLSFINSLKISGITDSLSFSILLNDDKTINGIKGTMYIGKHEDFSKNETVSCPLKFDKSKKYWAYNLKSFGLYNSVNEINSNKTYQVIFDTASNVIVLPLKYFQDINKNLSLYECKYVTFGEFENPIYKLACTNKEKLPNFKLKLNGQNFLLTKDYIFYEKENVYYSKIIFNGENGIIGTPFFSIFHTMFDKEKKMLRFYPKSPEYIERGDIEEKEEPEKDKIEPEEGGFKMVYLVYIFIPLVIIIIVILVVICAKIHRNKKGENLMNDLEQNDEENAILNN